MQKKLSIIIPCYNCQETLREAVESCFIQGLDNFEVVMVDDGSTDNTRQLMQQLANEHSEIKIFFHDENRGGGAARNTAVEKSEGGIIFCLDSDDLLPKGSLSKMVKYLQEKKCDGVTINKSIKFSGKDINNIIQIDEESCFDKKISLKSLLEKNKNFIPVYVNFMYTKSAFNKMGGYPTSHGYDTQGFAWRFLCAGLVVFTCPDAEYLHRTNHNESYFLREYNNGKMNYNWRDIFLEHYYVFNKETVDFICNFDCSNFTKNLLEELRNIPDPFIPDFESTFGKIYSPLKVTFPEPVYINRNSLLGYYLRINYRIKKIVTNICKK